MNRRNFIRTGVAGAAGMAAFSPAHSSATMMQEQKTITRTLGRTGMVIPVISFGVWRADNPSLCRAAYDKGIKFFDTAHTYQNGNNETMLGNVFKDYPRDSFYMTTKVKIYGLDSEGRPSKTTTTNDFLERFATSLSRLQMDYVDVLYIHDVRSTEVLEYKPIINALRKLKNDKKIKFAGISTHSNEPKVISAAADLKIFDVILTSYNFRQTYLNDLSASIRKAAASGIGIVAMKTMAGGGFIDKEKTRKINAPAALKWALSNPDITTCVPGITEFDQLDTDVRLLTDITLTDLEKQELAELSADAGFYCTQCTNCLPQCPNKLPVNDLMRAYMYAYGYSSTKMAYSLLDELGTGDDPCAGCSDCRISCTKKFNVRDKIADISRLITVPEEFLT